MLFGPQLTRSLQLRARQIVVPLEDVRAIFDQVELVPEGRAFRLIPIIQPEPVYTPDINPEDFASDFDFDEFD